jgi:hypothetical protein
MISRRKFFGLLAAGAIIAPELLLPRKTFFLPPMGGWISPLASLKIEFDDQWVTRDMYAEGLASGKFTYDEHTKMMSVWRLDEPVTRSLGSGKEFEWQDEPFVVLDSAGDIVGTKKVVYRGNLHERELAQQLSRFQPARRTPEELRRVSLQYHEDLAKGINAYGATADLC